MTSELLVRLAGEQGVRIAVAESLTGGALASRIVDVPGASNAFSGGIVSYATEVKHRVLGVEAEILLAYGPVDAQVAQQMALGVRRVCAVTRPGEAQPCWAELGIATTGVAGPEPDAVSRQAPGTVWIGISSALGERALELSLSGDRVAIREQSVLAAIQEGISELRRLQEAQ